MNKDEMMVKEIDVKLLMREAFFICWFIEKLCDPKINIQATFNLNLTEYMHSVLVDVHDKISPIIRKILEEYKQNGN